MGSMPVVSADRDAGLSSGCGSFGGKTGDATDRRADRTNVGNAAADAIETGPTSTRGVGEIHLDP
jgi:hypothetical protein